MDSPQAESRLAAIRAEILRHGQSLVPCDELLVFVSRAASIRSQFAHIFATAEKEGWSLEFRPDGTVRFANIQPPEGRNTDVVSSQGEERRRASIRD